MNEIKFIKMHGQGNDFVMIDAVNNTYELSAGTIAAICDRHFGIGADGLILVKKSDKADFFMDYYNQDGTVAEMCGNGIRCMAAFIVTLKLSDKKKFKIDTRAGIRTIQILHDSVAKASSAINDDLIRNSQLLDSTSVRVDMGSPVFDPGQIPVDISMGKEGDKSIDQSNKPRISLSSGIVINDYPLNVCGKVFKINCVSMGNPHCVIYLENNIDLLSAPVSEWGRAIENHPIFPKKTNVEFIKIKDNEIFMRVWERGVGETLACGTGACASAVCSMALNKINSRDVKVNLPGGILNIFWNNKNSGVFLEGKVSIAFEGTYTIKD